MLVRYNAGWLAGSFEAFFLAFALARGMLFFNTEIAPRTLLNMSLDRAHTSTRNLASGSAKNAARCLLSRSKVVAEYGRVVDGELIRRLSADVRTSWEGCVKTFSRAFSCRVIDELSSVDWSLPISSPC